MEITPTRVLMIEGDADAAAMMGSYLADAPDHLETYAVTQASRLSTACVLLTQHAFDVVLIDLVLPKSVGLEGFRKIHEMMPTTPIIVLTGLQDVPLAIQAVKLGAHDYFIKGSPDCASMKRAIRYALERRRMCDSIDALLAADDTPQLVVDSETVVRYANAAARTLLGMGREILVDQPCAWTLPEGVAEAMVPVPKNADKFYKLRVRAISWNGAPARLISVWDSSRTDEVQRLRAEAKEDLRVVEVKNHLMNNIAHELRNTLATIKTAAFCLRDGVAGELTQRQSQLTEMIARNADRQSKIIENVLDLARFQSGKLKIQFGQLDVNALIADTVAECGLSGPSAKVQVDVDASLPTIKGDPDLIGQVLRNLIDNALRFAKSKVFVEATPVGTNAVAISVMDDGEGIPPHRMNDLFTEFIQLQRSPYVAGGGQGYQGTGLGLTICKEIVEGHQGKIWAENVPGRGARFNVHLPTDRPVVSVINPSSRGDLPAMVRTEALGVK